MVENGVAQMVGNQRSNGEVTQMGTEIYTDPLVKAAADANGGRGMNWINQYSRLAIYLRDGMACVYCGRGLEAVERLTLDHIVSRQCGGSNDPRNLVTACISCNSARQDMQLTSFLLLMSDCHGGLYVDLLRHVRACRRRKPRRKEARALIARRGHLRHVLSEFRQFKEEGSWTSRSGSSSAV